MTLAHELRPLNTMNNLGCYLFEIIWVMSSDSCPIGVLADLCPVGAPWMRE